MADNQTLAASPILSGWCTLNGTASQTEHAVYECVAKMLLSSEQLFQLCYSHYTRAGRGACVALFDSVEHIQQSSKPVVFKYIELSDLLVLRYPPICELVRVYNPRSCFALLVQVVVHPHVTSAAIIARRDHGEHATRKNDCSVMGQLDKRLQVPRSLQTKLNAQ